MVVSLRVWAVSVSAACSPVGLGGQCVAPTFSGGVGLGDSTGSAPLHRTPEPEHVGAGEALRPRQGRELLRQGPGRAGGVQRGWCVGPLHADVLLPAPAVSAAQDTQPPGRGGNSRAELTSPEPQH